MNKTQIAIKSTYISLFITVVTGVLMFWRTSVIINTYGVEINSVSQATGEVFSYLVLLESGLGAAYLFNMYKPLADNNMDKVYALFLGLDKKLKKVSLYMLVGIILISIIYPFFLGENDLPLIRSGMIILILGLRFVFPYYFTIAKKNLLIAEEKKYLVTFIDGMTNAVIVLVEIILASVFQMSIEVILSIGLIFTILNNSLYKRMIKKKYAQYEAKNMEPSFQGDAMTNDIIVHQVATMANSHIDVFILSLVNLPAVTIYAAYNSAMNYPINLVKKVIENIRASIGLKLSQDDANMFSVFREILSLNYMVSGIVIPLFIIMINEFITLWIGEQFLLGQVSIILFALILFHRLTINLIYVVRDGKGLYKESKIYTILTAVSNTVLSVVLVHYFSINGLLFATVFSSYLIMDYGNLKLVYNTVFKKSLWIVVKDYVALVAAIAVSLFISNYILATFFETLTLSWINFLIKSSAVGLVTTTVTILYLLYFNDSFKHLLSRMRAAFIK